MAAALPAPLMAKGGDFVQINAFQPRGANPPRTFTASARGDWGNDLAVQVRPMVGNIMNILPDPTIAGNNPALTTVVQTVNAAGPPATTTPPAPTVAHLHDNDHILRNRRQLPLNHVH